MGLLLTILQKMLFYSLSQSYVIQSATKNDKITKITHNLTMFPPKNTIVVATNVPRSIPHATYHTFMSSICSLNFSMKTLVHMRKIIRSNPIIERNAFSLKIMRHMDVLIAARKP